MKVGDVLEWLAAACLVAAAFFATHHIWPAFLTGGACLAYLAQCHAQQAVPKPRLRLPRWPRKGEA